MSKRTYHPERGDLVLINFHPAAGREIDKRRPAIVLSPLNYNRQSGFCVIVPTSTDLRPGPMWIRMPDGLLPHPSMVLCDYVKSYDYRERSGSFLGKVPTTLIDEIVSNLIDLVDPAP